MVRINRHLPKPAVVSRRSRLGMAIKTRVAGWGGRHLEVPHAVAMLNAGSGEVTHDRGGIARD
jgi:hypothetical protein